MPTAWLASPVSAAPALTRLGAQAAARHELAKAGYRQAQPPWWFTPIGWIVRKIGDLFGAMAEATGGGAALSVLLALLVVVIGLIVWRVGPGAKAGRAHSEELTLDPERTATDHRATAERYAARQRWAEAVRERLRAVSRDLEDRALVDRRPGRTAYELAYEGGRALPACAAMLREAADRFAAIWYGDRTASAEDYRRLTEIDAAVRDARPSRTAAAEPALLAP